MVIGLIGRKGSGKDTVALMLKNELKKKGIVLEKRQMAFNLKKACALMTNKFYNDFEDNSIKDKQYQEPMILDCDSILSFLGYFGAPADVSANIYEFLKDKNYSHIINSNRELLQYLGTEIVRDMLGKNTHIEKAMESIANSENNYIFTDIRFENEVEIIKNNKFSLLIGIYRNNTVQDSHISESATDILIRNNADLVVHNNVSLSELEGIVSKLSLFVQKVYESQYK